LALLRAVARCVPLTLRNARHALAAARLDDWRSPWHRQALMNTPAADAPDPRTARVRSLVLKLFAFVVFTLVLGFACGVYSYSTDRSIKELVFGNEARVH